MLKDILEFCGRFARQYIKETDRLLLAVCIALSCLSVALIGGLVHAGALGTDRPLKMQLAASLVGLAAAIVISKIDYHTMAELWKLHQPVAYGLVLLTFTSLGVQVSEYIDDRNWLDIPGLPQFQPSELLKISFILTFAYHLSKVKDELNDWKTLILVCLHGITPVLLIHLQGDDGTAVIMLVIVAGMMFAAGLSWKYILPLFAAVPPVLAVLWIFLLDNDKKGRILALVSPDSLSAADRSKYLWQQMKGEIAIGNGGVWGNGIFSENGQFQFVPEVHNDFIFSYIGESLGFIGCIGVLILLLLLCISMIRNAKNASDDLGRYICVGVFSMFAAQIAINIGMNLSMFPVIGITLPFLSAGGTSVATLYLSIGVVLSVHVNSRANLFRT
ncbi:MAG: cell division protein [Ruminococcaceae bacterium]|nr:cell division protein [Oscillospiraceae bacterium]MBQ9970308.1 FtsW/RodA/SpoVE family cell cycle protein [Oscillospiraceae bacterium]